MNRTGRTAAFLGGVVVAGVVAAVVAAVMLRFWVQGDVDTRGASFLVLRLLLAVVGLSAVALPVVGSLATRFPFAGVATALAIAVLTLPVQLVVFGSAPTIRPTELVVTLVTVLTVAAVDAVVLLYRGRPLPLVPVLLAVIGMSVVGAVVTVGQYVTVVGAEDVVSLLTQPLFLVNLLVVAPAGLLAAGVVGWTLRPDVRPVMPPPAAWGPVAG